MPTMDDAFSIPTLKKGDKLYHYTSAVGMQGICGGEFWVTECNFLNDFTEFHVATDIFCEVMDKHILNKDVCEKLKSKVCTEIERINSYGTIEEEIAYYGNYVISFSLDYDSTLMWSEYSDFMGYCLKFDFETLLNSFNNFERIEHGKVIYDRAQQSSIIEYVIEDEFINRPKGFDYLNSWDDFNQLSDKDIEDCYWLIAIVIDSFNRFFKLPCFEGEHEYRFVFDCVHDGGRCKPEEYEKQFFRIKNEILIPYVKKSMVSMESLEEVLIGPKNNSDIAILGAERFLRNLKLDVPVVKSKMPLRY